MSVLDSVVQTTVDGYDLAAERGRYAFPDVTLAGETLNRGHAVIDITGDMNNAHLRAARVAHEAAAFTSTLDGDVSPVLELGYPQAGHFVSCAAGTYFDLYLGVAQKLVDENHPNLRAMVANLQHHGVLLRREINTDDYLVARLGVEGIATPQDLCSLADGMAARAFPSNGPYKTFLSNSGTEAIEAGLKLAYRVAHGRLLERHGAEVEAELMRQLDIPKVGYFADRGGATLYADYPFFLIACHGAFHGRTLGALSATFSKAAHKLGYPNTRWQRHIPFNGAASDLEDLLDPRPLPEILKADGGVRAVLDAGRVPADLVAVFLAEGFQGEGGYTLASPQWIQAMQKTCRAHDVLYLADEVQTFGRTGTPFLSEQLGLAPDILCMAKSAVVGMTVARAEYEKYLHLGWHSNTWGGGKVLDTNFAFTTLDTYLNHQDPLFEGNTYVQNSRIKGEYLRSNLAWLASQHGDTLIDFGGLGCMFGITVTRRERIIELGWQRGLKLLGCGPSGEESRIRMLLLSDVTTHEIDQLTAALDRVFTEIEDDE